jgi:hypothetical protein
MNFRRLIPPGLRLGWATVLLVFICPPSFIGCGSAASQPSDVPPWLKPSGSNPVEELEAEDLEP